MKTKQRGVSAGFSGNSKNNSAAKTPFSGVSAELNGNLVKNNEAKKSECAWSEFLEQCLKFDKVADLAEFLNVFLTISEREEIPKRLQIIRELLKGEKTQREIAQNLRVSIANITRASNIIKSGQYNLTKLLK